MPDESPDPTDRPLSTVIDDLERDRGTSQFRAVEGAEIQCLTCRVTSPAADQRNDAVARIEGASDPEEQAAVVMVRCPHCGAEGSLILRYGPAASPDEAEVLRALD